MEADSEANLLSFEKTRFDYIMKMFDKEASRKQNLETRSQFYLTLITAFLTAIYLSLPFLGILQSFMHNAKVDPSWRVAITVLLTALGLALLFSLIAVLLSMRLQYYINEYPNQPFRSLFTPKPEEFERDNEAGLLRFTARVVIEALEKNKILNDKKAKWVKWASYGIIFSVIILVVSPFSL